MISFCLCLVPSLWFFLVPPSFLNKKTHLQKNKHRSTCRVLRTHPAVFACNQQSKRGIQRTGDSNQDECCIHPGLSVYTVSSVCICWASSSSEATQMTRRTVYASHLLRPPCPLAALLSLASAAPSVAAVCAAHPAQTTIAYLASIAQLPS